MVIGSRTSLRPTKHITAARLTTTRGSDFPRPGRLKEFAA